MPPHHLRLLPLKVRQGEYDFTRESPPLELLEGHNAHESYSPSPPIESLIAEFEGVHTDHTFSMEPVPLMPQRCPPEVPVLQANPPALWYGHNMSVFPPTNIISEDGLPSTMSWLFMPVILRGLNVAWGDSHVPEWPMLLPPWINDIACRLARPFRIAGVTWGGLAAHRDGPYHLTAAAQEALIRADGLIEEHLTDLAMLTLYPDNQDFVDVAASARSSSEYHRAMVDELADDAAAQAMLSALASC